MHYYQFNIGDYTSHTSHLSPIEDIAYRRIIDWYYLNEQPLNMSSTDVAREISMRDYQGEVDYVLDRYFKKTNKGYTQKRIEKEIKIFKKNQKARSEAGKKSGIARRNKALQNEQTLNRCSTSDELNINHKPLTNNHKPTNSNRAKSSRFVPPQLQDVLDYCKEKSINIDCHAFIDFYQSKNWMVGKNKMKDWKAAARNWARRSKENGEDPEPVSSISHNSVTQNIADLEDQELERAKRNGFNTIEEHRQYEFEQTQKKYIKQSKT